VQRDGDRLTERRKCWQLGSGNGNTLSRPLTRGIGFKTVDQIAQKMGIPHDSILRACAGLNHVLLEATGEGHCALPVELLKEEAGKLLLVKEEIVDAALERTLAAGDVVRETIADLELVFLPTLKRAEEGITARIKNLATSQSNYPPIDVDKALLWCQSKTGNPRALAKESRESRPHPPLRRPIAAPRLANEDEASKQPA
jgi:exodeoxyribonuclease V alpha subunit